MEKSDDRKSVKWNPLTKAIDRNIRRIGFDSNFISGITHHLKVLNNVQSEEDIKTRTELCNILMSKMFIDKMDEYPQEKIHCTVNENSNWAVPVVPSEVFGQQKPPEAFRKKCFYTCLKVGNVLDCRVATILPKEYNLRVIHKYGVTRALDDLNLQVMLPRNETEIALLGNELLHCEIIRVAVSDIKDNNVFVTVNEESIRGQLPKLGRLPEEELPFYVLNPPDPEQFSSYSKYLNNKKVLLGNPTRLNDIFNSFGLNRNAVYTFYNYESSVPSTGQRLLKESRLKDARNFIVSSTKARDRKNFDDSLDLINKAIEICPEDDPLMAKLYETKGYIYEDKDKPRYSKKAFVMWEKALTLDPNSAQAKQNLSKFIFLAANSFYQQKNYKKAFKAAECALQLNDKNSEAEQCLNYLKKKHPEVIENYDEESLHTLEEKKKEIVTKLKKIIS